ncbi:alpha/beta-hydrolase family protein [Rhodococcus sp. G-MC3]|uniref:alpha/beta-hydrolase family protein n=1 Tax=Rhodococcus sp. G-MC3 TaxID=3046209 RepID=UPI0024B93B28|nr:alpha/beta-hydrolase family protein [Rhodococcus sp. G-MC3]MDJ0391996.1 alpha/beta-hydrolase family protein [Rhodococcus sp. G-MC3]
MSTRTLVPHTPQSETPPTMSTRNTAPQGTAQSVPRTATSILVSAAVIASLVPSLLPRSSLMQAIVTGVFATAALGFAALAHRIVAGVRGTAFPTPAPHPVARRIAAAAGVTAILAAAVGDARWQNDLREAMDVPNAGALHWIGVLCGSVSVCSILVVLGLGISRGIGRLGPARTLAMVTACTVVGYLFVVPAALSTLSRSFAVSDALMDTSLAIPVSPAKSGSAASTVSWDLLGREGRKFVAGGTNNASVRTYVGLGAAPTVSERAAAAVDELNRAGGFAKSHIVVAVPTGSGWVDENAVSGAEVRFGGDVATVALQYSAAPSWATFLFAKSEANDSAAALLEAVSLEIDSLPEASRPSLYVYGQSLGSIGGSSAVANYSDDVCGTLWAGPPAKNVILGDAVVLANSSDPVVRWSSDLLMSPPDLDAVRVDAPLPQWIPVVSYLQTTIDMVSALAAPDGHGHRYGRDQGMLLPPC